MKYSDIIKIVETKKGDRQIQLAGIIISQQKSIEKAVAFAKKYPTGLKIEVRQGDELLQQIIKGDTTSNKDKMIVYVDALNLYYGLLRSTKYRRLDIYDFAQTQFSHDIVEIKFFFASIKPTLLDLEAPIRQKTYLEALKHYVGQKCPVTFIEGYFLDNVSKSGIDVKTGELVTIVTNEEKGTDVNIGVHIVNDACKRDDFDTICLISNDSDLSEALKIGKEIGKKIYLLSPVKRLTPTQRKSRKKKKIRISYPAGSLKQYADECNYDVSAKALSLSQMPATIEIGEIVINRPESRA